MLKIFWPPSILQLTLVGFLTVVAPLVAALWLVAEQLDSLGSLSQQSISEVAEAMRISRVLIEQTGAMERNARQYGVLDDKELLSVYKNRRTEFINAIEVLQGLDIGGDIPALVEELINNERRIFSLLQRSSDSISTPSAEMPVLMATAYSISRHINEWTDARVAGMKQYTGQTLQLLRQEALILISTAALLAALFTLQIARPLRQIDRAIHQLGRGSYEDPIRVGGPFSLRELGLRLEWLRGRLKELERQRTKMLQHVSHELKTPLAALQEGIALLNEGVLGKLTEQQIEVTGILRNNCLRLHQLIENLLSLRAGHPEDLQSMPLPVRLDSVIIRSINDQAIPVKAAGLKISRQLKKITVYGDREQLRAIVDNLLINAIRYSPVGGTISVQLYRENEHAVLHVIDEGPGIAPEERRLVFEPFYQGRAPEREHMNGTGLGLAITAEYVRLHGGTLSILDSDGGAHFKVSLPVMRQSLPGEEAV